MKKEANGLRCAFKLGFFHSTFDRSTNHHWINIQGILKNSHPYSLQYFINTLASFNIQWIIERTEYFPSGLVDVELFTKWTTHFRDFWVKNNFVNFLDESRSKLFYWFDSIPIILEENESNSGSVNWNFFSAEIYFEWNEFVLKAFKWFILWFIIIIFIFFIELV